MSVITSVPHEEVEIDVDSLETSASRLICLIKPTWVSKKLLVKKLGVDENRIYYSIFPGGEEIEPYGVVIKLYPPNSDVYTDHETALRLIDELDQHDIALHVLFTFNNGYFSNYIQGKILDNKEEHTRELVARKLAEFHSISLKSNHTFSFVDRLKLFIDLLTKKNCALHERLIKIKENPPKNNPTLLTSLASAIGLNTTPTPPLTLDQLESQLKDTSWAELATEVDFIRLILEDNWSKQGLPVVLCLYNLNIHNFLYDAKNKSMSLVDFDHCSSTYFLIDLVSYFLELEKEEAENKYPSRHLQKFILTEYLKRSSLNLSTITYDPLKPTDSELEHLCDLCGLLIAPVHLYWALWAFLQALLTKPTSPVDFINNGKNRLAQYQKHKQNFFLPLYQPQTDIH